MAVKPMYYDGNGDYQDADGVIFEYICDSASDVSSLPTGASETDLTKKPRPGSRALVAATTEVYVLDSTRTWVKLA